MTIYVVLYEKNENKETKVVGAYTDEVKANNRVKFERDLIEMN